MKTVYIILVFLFFSIFVQFQLSAQTLVIDTIKTSQTWTVPSDASKITVECWGAGGGGARASGVNKRGSGGGGGAFASSSLNVTPSSSFTVTVGTGGAGTAGPNNGGNSFFGSNLVVAEGGKGVAPNGATGGAGGSTLNSTGTVKYNGGNGANHPSGGGGGGGGGAGSTQNGSNGSGSTGGTGGINSGGKGGNGPTSGNTPGFPGLLYGGGGGGGRTQGNSSANGGNGANGLVVVKYYRNLVVSGLVTISSNSTYNNITIQPGGQLTLNSGVTLTAFGDFLIESSSSGTGTFVVANGGTLSVSGTIQVQQYLLGNGSPGAPDGRMWYMTSPLSGATSATFDAASSSNKLWSYSEPTLAYTEITNNSTSLTPLNGYVVRMGQNGIVTFSGGSFNNGVSNINLTNTGTTAGKRGYNLIGNPYPSFLNWEDVDTTYVSSTMWYRTVNSSNNAMVFDTYNSTSKVGTNNNGNGAVTQYIPPMQGFWVKVKTDNSNCTLTFRNNMRSHQTGQHLKSNSNSDIIRIIFGNATYSDENILLFNSSVKNGVNGWDSEKMLNSVTVPQMWMTENNKQLVINSQSRIVSGMSVPLFMNVPLSGMYSISLNLEEFNNSSEIFLEDKQTNTMHNIRNNPYYFNSGIVSNNNRFNLLLFRPGNHNNNSSGVSLLQDPTISVYPNPFVDELIVEANSSGNATNYWSIIDINGKSVMSGTLVMEEGISSYSVSTTQLPAGLYMFMSNINGNILSERIIKY